jgi:hypothetical protein
MTPEAWIALLSLVCAAFGTIFGFVLRSVQRGLDKSLAVSERNQGDISLLRQGIAVMEASRTVFRLDAVEQQQHTLALALNDIQVNIHWIRSQLEGARHNRRSSDRPDAGHETHEKEEA